MCHTVCSGDKMILLLTHTENFCLFLTVKVRAGGCLFKLEAVCWLWFSFPVSLVIVLDLMKDWDISKPHPKMSKPRRPMSKPRRPLSWSLQVPQARRGQHLCRRPQNKAACYKMRAFLTISLIFLPASEIQAFLYVMSCIFILPDFPERIFIFPIKSRPVRELSEIAEANLSFPNWPKSLSLIVDVS